MSALGQFLPKSDVCVMSVQLPNNGLKLDVAALRIWATSGQVADAGTYRFLFFARSDTLRKALSDNMKTSAA
jgi:hypothetical protein